MSPLARSVGAGLRKSAEDARRIARMHGTRIWVIEKGKLVGKKP
jgi:ribosome biogenesis protein Nip4